MNLMMLNVGYATHHADWNWQKVSSPFIRIFYIEEGEAMLHLPETDVRLKPEHMYIIPAYTIHSYECHGVFKLYYIHMYEGFKNELNLHETYELPTEVPAGDYLVQTPKVTTPPRRPPITWRVTGIWHYGRRWS